ncbi:hypothetical protein OROMI_016810 [Orobanche minor]
MRRPGRSCDFRCGRRDGGDPEPMRMRAPIQNEKKIGSEILTFAGVKDPCKDEVQI